MSTADIRPPFRERLIYAFGHLASSCIPHAHSGDSADEARDVMNEMGLSQREQLLIDALAEHVAHNYDFHGEGQKIELALKEVPDHLWNPHCEERCCW